MKNFWVTTCDKMFQQDRGCYGDNIFNRCALTLDPGHMIHLIQSCKAETCLTSGLYYCSKLCVISNLHLHLVTFLQKRRDTWTINSNLNSTFNKNLSSHLLLHLLLHSFSITLNMLELELVQNKLKQYEINFCY